MDWHHTGVTIAFIWISIAAVAVTYVMAFAQGRASGWREASAKMAELYGPAED
jgi:hypothetical protein